MTLDEVVREISARTWRLGVSILLSPARNVEADGFQVGGYFDEDAKVLAVATGRSTDIWLGTLLHEYSHVTQWIEQTPCWLAYNDSMWEWLSGKPVRNAKAAVRSVQTLEADCERRSMRLARELDAPIDLERYARASNAYIHFHNIVADERKWYRPGFVMMESEVIMAAANPTFDTDFSKTPKALRNALFTAL